MYRLIIRFIAISATLLAFSVSHATLYLQEEFSDWKTRFAGADHSHELLATFYSSKPIDARELDLRYAGIHYRYFWDFANGEGPRPFSFFAAGHLESVVEGPGSYLVGGSLGLRYRCPFEIFGLTPYAQFSWGVVGNDVYKDPDQFSIGGFIEFRNNLTVGVAVPLGRDNQTALHVELAVEHVSNGGTSPRNAGLNLAGVAVGLHY